MMEQTPALINAKRRVPAHRTIKDEETMRQLVRDYFDHIINNNFEDVPSKTDLADWSGVPYITLKRSLLDFYPECDEFYNDLLADTIMKGAMLGKYKEASSIFTVKNRCGWTDKKEITTNNAPKGTAQDKEEAEEALKALGYIKASNVIEVEDAIKKNKSKNNPKSKAK